MTINDCFTRVMKLMNYYSVAGTQIPDSDGNMKDLKTRAVALMDAGQFEICGVSPLLRSFSLSCDPPEPLGGMIGSFYVRSEAVDIRRGGDAHSMSMQTADAMTVTIWNVSAGVSSLLTTFSTEASDFLKSYTAVFTPDSDAEAVVFSFSGFGTVHEFAAFSRAYDDADDVPVFGDRFAYPLPADFRSISNVTLATKLGVRSRDFRDFGIRTGQLLLPWDFRGTAEIIYAANPVPVDDTSSGTDELSLPDEAAQALCFYVAAGLTAEDDSELAARFRSHYRSCLSNLSPVHSSARILPTIYLDPRRRLVN